MSEPCSGVYDAVVVGSGFGGAMAALSMVRAGMRVLMLERGYPVAEGPARADPVGGFFQLTPAYTADTPFLIEAGTRRSQEEGICACVGGASVFYGGASLRFREADFLGAPEIVRRSGAEWPIDYAELERFYGEAERLLGVAGEAGVDPTEPPRSGAFPRKPPPLPPLCDRIARTAEELGLRPFRLPLAFDERGHGCLHCDGYACASGAKQDLAAAVIPDLVRAGLELRAGMVVTAIEARKGRVCGVTAIERRTHRRVEIRAEQVVLAAGALASPQLLLASGLGSTNPGGEVVGRYLLRHCNAFVYALFPRNPNREGLHHKQLAINDFYFGDDAPGAPAGKLGNIQQVMHPQPGGILRRPARALIRRGRAGRVAVRSLAAAVTPLSRRMSGLQVIAEDVPQKRNRVVIDRGATDRYGLPVARIHHRYSRRDLAAREALVRRARWLLAAVPGAYPVHVHRVETFSHAVGTVRMGNDPRTSALDRWCAFRGVENLYVTDGSFMPTSAGVNPSLTIAANALRVGEHIARR